MRLKTQFDLRMRRRRFQTLESKQIIYAQPIQLLQLIERALNRSDEPCHSSEVPMLRWRERTEPKTLIRSSTILAIRINIDGRCQFVKPRTGMLRQNQFVHAKHFSKSTDRQTRIKNPGIFFSGDYKLQANRVMLNPISSVGQTRRRPQASITKV